MASYCSRQKLWHYALCGSPFVQALALTLLDKELDGKISEFARRVLSSKDCTEIWTKKRIEWMPRTREKFKNFWK